MINEYFKLAFTNLFNRKLRSWLTMIGIFIGIATVVALISLGQGLQEAVITQFSLIGVDKLFVTAKEANFGHSGVNREKLGKKDLEVIKRVKGVESVAGRIFTSVQVEFNNKINTLFSISIPDTEEGLKLLKEVELLRIDKGRFLKVNEKNKVLIGAKVHEKELFGKKINVGNKILIKGEKFKVVGILKKTGNPSFDSGVWISEKKLRKFTGEKEKFNAIMVKVSSGFNISKVAENIEKIMRKDRNQKKGEEDFTVKTSEQLLQGFNSVLNIVQIVLVGIAAISLAVGGIGIMNTMYTSVLERTREIGIMKAVGAKNKDILLIMLFESGLLGLTGGAIGIIIGIGLSKTVEYLATQIMETTLIKAYISIPLIGGALLFSFLIGTISGLLPAKKASNLAPVTALRYE